MPLVERITTVTGSCITEPKNLVTRVGTLVSEIIEQCGGFKEDVKEVATGYECGLNIANYNDIKIGDLIEAYEEVEVKKTL